MTNAEQSWYTNYVSYTWAPVDVKTCMPQPSRNKKHQAGSHLLPSLYILYYFLNKENLFITLLEFRYFDYFLFKNNNSMDEKYFFWVFFLTQFSLTMEMQVLGTSYNQSFFLELKVQCKT